MIISTEQVSKYHPDKYADQISDAILTECLKQDKNSHCGIETMVKGTTVVLGGEITSNADVDYEKVVKKVANKLGYKVDAIVNLISKQSPEIQNAVDSDEDIGAGDQGIMFGYAVNETEELLPTAFVLANKIIKAIENDVENNAKTILLGDAKTQVSWDADKKEVVSVLVSACHTANSGLSRVRRYIKNLLKDIIPKECKNIMINPAGTWTVGGPISDCGLTGRKIVCDQYGGFCRVGGGAFSGKDPSKVDRSASYMARRIAKELIYKFGFDEAMVQLGYAIGVSKPFSVLATCVKKDAENPQVDMSSWVVSNYDLTPRGIIEYLGLYQYDYEKVSEGCHYYGTDI